MWLFLGRMEPGDHQIPFVSLRSYLRGNLVAIKIKTTFKQQGLGRADLPRLAVLATALGINSGQFKQERNVLKRLLVTPSSDRRTIAS